MKRLIEEDFPIFDVSEHSAREKNIRHGHISTLHIWWARRPLAACRAAIYASLVPAPDDEEEIEDKLGFIARLSNWDNSLNEKMLDNAKQDILDANGKEPPKVLDCFAGGGAIPLEALRLGCETYALEYNPVAVLIEKATLEYPQKYGKKLVKDVEKWGKWVLEEAQKEIGQFYPKEKDPRQKQKSIGNAEGNRNWSPVGYIWARTINCQNPNCGAKIPLIRQFWLRKKTHSDGNIKWEDSVYLKPIVNKDEKKIDFEIIENKKIEEFNPSTGTRPTSRSRGSFSCPICNTTYKSKDLREYAKNNGFGQKMLAVVLRNEQVTGKKYRIATNEDKKIFKHAENALKEKVDNWDGDYPAIPNEQLPPDGTLGFRVNKYGIKTWGELFNPRQLLALITFAEKVGKARNEMLNKGYEDEYSKAIVSYLALALDRLATRSSNLSVWHRGSEGVEKILAFQAFPMQWEYAESNVFQTSTVAGFYKNIKSITKVIENLSEINNDATVFCSSTTSLPKHLDDINAIITDPPYYDNVPYADLSDFFYVWLKRTVGDLYPDLFATPLTPKSQEIIQESIRHDKSEKKAKQFYEDMMAKSFQEMCKVLKSDGIVTIVFAHKKTAAWETLINALIKAGLVPTSSWPIHTEMKARLRARESAALASSFFLTCRKRKGGKEAYFKDIKGELQNRIQDRLDQFWSEGIRGADFFISAIGPAVEVFGKYSKVKKLSGEEVNVSELLTEVRALVMEYALGKVLKRVEVGKIDPITQFYIYWRWAYNGKKIEYDDARKIAQAVGLELENERGRKKLIRGRSKIRVLKPQDRDIDSIGKSKPVNLIDAMHKACLLWDSDKTKELEKFLSETGYLNDPKFWETLRDLSELLPEGDREKRLIQGLSMKASSVSDKSSEQLTLDKEWLS